MKVTQDTNFCRVFELPQAFPGDFCFGGGIPVGFKMVDWFNPVPTMTLGPSTDGMPCLSGSELDMTPEQNEKLRAGLLDFLSRKRYVLTGRKYLVLTDYGDAFCFPLNGGGK